MTGWNDIPIRYQDVDGHRLAYKSAGRGEPILLVHGIPTYGFIWRNLLPRLSQNHRVIAVDLLGCGESDKPLDVSYSIKSHAERLIHFADALGLEQFHLVGHDVGGGAAQIIAVRHPHRLFDLTLINTVAYDFWPVQPIIAMRTPIVRQFAIASLDWGTFKLIVRRGIYHKQRVTSELMDLFWQPMKTQAGRKAFLHFAKCLNNRDLLEIEADLRRLPMPVLIIRGESDPYLGKAISDKLHREIPNSTLIKIETGGHFIQEDEPEQISQAMLSFFKEQSGS